MSSATVYVELGREIGEPSWLAWLLTNGESVIGSAVGTSGDRHSPVAARFRIVLRFIGRTFAPVLLESEVVRNRRSSPWAILGVGWGHMTTRLSDFRETRFPQMSLSVPSCGGR